MILADREKQAKIAEKLKSIQVQVCRTEIGVKGA